MNGDSAAREILSELRSRGVRVGLGTTGKLRLAPARAIEPALLERVRRLKAELLTLLSALSISDAEENSIDRLAQADGWEPLKEIPPTVAREIQRIETDALRLGWTRERLWNFHFWPQAVNRPRGLASVMSDTDTIVALSRDYIAIGSAERNFADYRRFWRLDG